MKKIFLGLAVLAFLSTGFVACKGKKAEGDKKEQTNDGKMDGTTDGKMDGNTDGKMEGTADGLSVPNFTDPTVTQWCQDYKNFLDSYVAAINGKDYSKITALSQEFSTQWASKAMEVGMKLSANPEEAKKFSDFTTAVSNQFTEAMKKSMPNAQ
ncbi:MAG: hypothetical protein IPP93_01225 [Chitinophagaceae bacterium]|nr:hypothetical protein [Chitinophagaceae bacterium]MBL0336281.1 hypothetical protein [Chitinophagaceae bacterium]